MSKQGVIETHKKMVNFIIDQKFSCFPASPFVVASARKYFDSYSDRQFKAKQSSWLHTSHKRFLKGHRDRKTAVDISFVIVFYEIFKLEHQSPE